MKKLLGYAEPGDVIVVCRVDRLGRSLIDVLNTVNLLRERGVLVRSISDGIDPGTTNGRLMLNMLATLAEYERELIVERVNAGIAAARTAGTRFGRPAVDSTVIAEKLGIVTAARQRGRTAADAARLVGCSRATLYRHQHVLAAREGQRCSPPWTAMSGGGFVDFTSRTRCLLRLSFGILGSVCGRCNAGTRSARSAASWRLPRAPTRERGAPRRSVDNEGESLGADAIRGGDVLDRLRGIDHLATQLVLELLGKFSPRCGHADLYFQ